MSIRLLFAALLLTAMGCSVTQYLPPDELLYRGASLDIVAADSIPTEELEFELESLLNQKTNAKLPLIGYRNLWRYYKFEEKKRKKPEKYLDDPDEIKGEEPIFYDETVVESVNNLLENRASNNGYFQNESTFTVDTIAEAQEAAAHYTISVGAPYTIDSVRTVWRDSSVARVLTEVEPETFLRVGSRYDLDALKSERNRWQQALKQEGYFYANNNDFLFLADTVTGERKVALLAKLKTEAAAESLKPQRIAGVNIYPNFDPRDTLNPTALPLTEIDGLNIYCSDCPLRPRIVDEAFYMQAGDLYDPTRHRKTLRRLASYNTFRYISMDYEPVAGNDSLLTLNAYMAPLPRHRFEGELGLTYNSARYVGPNVRLAYTNRNLLRGAELLNLVGDFSYAIFLGNTDQIRVPSSAIIDLNASLTLPRLWIPGRDKLSEGLISSGTVIQLGGKLENLSLTLSKFSDEISEYDLQDLAQLVEDDPEASESVSLLQLRTSYGYTWQRNVRRTHAFNPIAIRLQNPVVSNDEVLTIARNLGLASGGSGDANENSTSRFDRMLVFSPNYTFTYDTRADGEDRHNLFLRQYLSMNLNNVFPTGLGQEDAERVTSIYPQVESDLRYYLNFDRKSTLAMRLHGGIAFPLSELAIVPYFDLYSLGGPNSLRGFSPRQLGPGQTIPLGNNLLTSAGFGNLLLESSIEYRYKVTPIIGLAAFVDAGNVWTYKTTVEPLESDFSTATFSNDLAANYGIGFRFDLTFLLLRLDLAKPYLIPYEDAVNAFRFPQKFIGEPVDRAIRVVIGFGYPF